MGVKNNPEVIDKERRVLEMRLAGITFDAIAKNVGYASPGSAYNAYKRALVRTLQEPAEEIREAEVARLDRLMAGVWTAALRGEVRSVEAVLRIMDRRAKLLGLDQPTRVQAEVISYDIGSVNEHLASLAFGLAHSNPQGRLGTGESETESVTDELD
jgi:hypothetical protein